MTDQPNSKRQKTDEKNQDQQLAIPMDADGTTICKQQTLKMELVIDGKESDIKVSYLPNSHYLNIISFTPLLESMAENSDGILDLVNSLHRALTDELQPKTLKVEFKEMEDPSNTLVVMKEFKPKKKKGDKRKAKS